MPLALSPNEQFAIVLESDRDKPEGERPTFFFKYLSGVEMLEVAKITDRMDKSKGPEDVMKAVYGMAKKYLRGWENMIDTSTGAEIPFNLEWLEKILGIAECQQLLGRLLYQLPDLEDKKKLEPPSASSTARPAKGAGASKNAEKNQRQPNRS